MIIGVKSGFKEDQLLSALQKGFKHIEFHTTYSDYQNNIDFHKIRNLLDSHNVSCHAVHVPICAEDGSEESLSIATLNRDRRDNNMELYKKVIDSAKILCSTKKPVIVSHIGTRYNINNHKEQYSKEYIQQVLNDGRNDLYTINNYIQHKNYNMTWVVENVPRFAYTKDMNVRGVYFGCNHDLPKYIEDLNLPDIKSCLDVCHILNTLNIDKLKDPFTQNSLEQYIKSYSKTLGLIHLNNKVGLGEQTHIHAQPFIPSKTNDMYLLKEFFTSLDKYNINCPITLEINETDYLRRPNLDLTIDSLKTVATQYNCDTLNNYLTTIGILPSNRNA